jgi:hypothetical protein
VYKVKESHFYILDIFCHTEDSRSLISNRVSSDYKSGVLNLVLDLFRILVAPEMPEMFNLIKNQVF